jgi:hypothetical protein
MLSLNKAIMGPSTQRFFFSSSDVIATTCFDHTTIIMAADSGVQSQAVCLPDDDRSIYLPFKLCQAQFSSFQIFPMSDSGTSRLPPVLLPSVSRLTKQCGILTILQSYRSPRTVMGITLLLYKTQKPVHFRAVSCDSFTMQQSVLLSQGQSLRSFSPSRHKMSQQYVELTVKGKKLWGSFLEDKDRGLVARWSIKWGTSEQDFFNSFLLATRMTQIL